MFFLSTKFSWFIKNERFRQIEYHNNFNYNLRVCKFNSAMQISTNSNLNANTRISIAALMEIPRTTID